MIAELITGAPYSASGFKQHRVNYLRSVLMMYYTSVMNPNFEEFAEQVRYFQQQPPFNKNFSLLDSLKLKPQVSDLDRVSQ